MLSPEFIHLLMVLSLFAVWMAWLIYEELTEPKRLRQELAAQKEAEAARARRLSFCIKAVTWSWLVTGFDDGVEYTILYAQIKGISAKEMIGYGKAETQTAMEYLNQHGIPIHNGPPGTV